MPYSGCFRCPQKVCNLLGSFLQCGLLKWIAVS